MTISPPSYGEGVRLWPSQALLDRRGHGGHGHAIPLSRKGGECDAHDHIKLCLEQKEVVAEDIRTISPFRRGATSSFRQGLLDKEEMASMTISSPLPRKEGEGDHDHGKPFLERKSWWPWPYHSLL